MSLQSQAELRILVVDDNESIRNLMCRTLKQEGFQNVISAKDGREGLDLCSQQEFDVLICDIVMPEIDGLEMIFTLRKTAPDLHIIAISGGGQVDAKNYLNLAAKAGADTLEKPFEITDLIRIIRGYSK